MVYSVNSNSRRRRCCYYCCCRCAICVLQWTVVQRIPPPPRLPRGVEAAAAAEEKPPRLPPPYLSTNAAHDFPTTPAGKITVVVVSRICTQRDMTSARGFSAVTVDDALKS